MATLIKFFGGPSDGQRFSANHKPLSRVVVEATGVTPKGVMHYTVFLYRLTKDTPQEAHYHLADIQIAVHNLADSTSDEEDMLH